MLYEVITGNLERPGGPDTAHAGRRGGEATDHDLWEWILGEEDKLDGSPNGPSLRVKGFATLLGHVRCCNCGKQCVYLGGGENMVYDARQIANWVVQRANRVGKHIRITSYNVCYTKLLRIWDIRPKEEFTRRLKYP